MSLLSAILLLVGLSLVSYAFWRTRRLDRELERIRQQQAMDERRAQDNCRPHAHTEVSPLTPPKAPRS